jgi:hypothetical protein
MTVMRDVEACPSASSQRTHERRGGRVDYRT